MKRKTSNSPYPVLYPNTSEYADVQGYRDVGFDIVGEPSIGVTAEHNLSIKFMFDLTDATLAELVANGTAKYYVNVECGHTYYRHAFVQSEKDFAIEIPYGDVADKIELFVGLVADKDVAGFSAPGFASRFGEAKFDIEKGDILAVGTGWDVDLEGVDGSVDPVVLVSRDEDESHSDLWVSGSADERKLVVHLASPLYDVYCKKQKKCKAELMALVMKPAILSALQRVILKSPASGAESREVDVDSRRWLRKLNDAIGRMMDAEGGSWDISTVRIDSDRGGDSLAYAVGVLMKRPLAKAMEEISKK